MSNQKLTAKDLEKKLKSAADILRKSLNASENYKLVLPLLFVKRLNDNFFERAERLIKEENLSKEEAYENPKRHTSFFVPKKAYYEKLQKSSSEVGKKINQVFKEIESVNEELEGTLVNAEFANTDKYTDEGLRKIISIFTEENLGDANLENEDAFGDAYEFLLEEYAGETKKKGGQFYTPRQVVRLMTNLVKPEPGMKICDPTCGSGGMLIQSRKYIEENFPKSDPDNITLEGQESNPDTANLCKMNLVVHGITDFKIELGDVLEKPKLLENGKLRTYHRVLANFPFSENWDNAEKENDVYNRFVLGIPPSKDKADFAFIQHMISCLNDEGKAAIVSSEGVLFRPGEEQKIREGLVEKDLLEAIIALPDKIFYGTTIPGCILILNKKKPKQLKKKILFVYAANYFQENPKRNLLRDSDINKILETLKKFSEEDRYSYIADYEEIKENEFNLNVPRYVDIAKPIDKIKIEKVLDEIQELNEKRKTFEDKLSLDLKDLGWDHN